ncbi:MAG: hypothetical protein AAF764_00830 [Pseudomonadota bacterium]
MKRNALIRELKKEARKKGLSFDLDKSAGKGSHYLLRVGGKRATIQSGELSLTHIRTIRKQLGLT